jgi:hypothetical protein
VRAQLLAVVAAVGRSDSFRGDGATSLAAWVAFRLGWHTSAATVFADVAQRLDTLPALAAAHAAGALSWDKLRSAVRLADAESDAAVAEAAQHMSPHQLALAARAKAVRDDDANDERQRRLWRRRDHRHGGTTFGGCLPDDQAAIVFDALDAIIERNRRDDPDWIPLEHATADALVELAATTTDADAADAARITLHHHPLSATTTLDDGTPIPPAVADYYACTAWIEPCGNDDTANPRVRRPSPRLRRRLHRRERGMCRFPGCRRTRNLHAHHIEHWPYGPTHEHNLVLLCPRHHRLIHLEHWTITGDPNATLTFTRPDGTVLHSGPTPLRADTAQRLD